MNGGGSTANAMAGVVGVLKVNGRIPRRAVVLPDGTLSDKVLHPDHAEVDVLSRLCELARRHGKQACYPRHAATLLEEALLTNAGGAWEAVRDDVMTGDMDLDGAAAVLRQSNNCTALVSCVVGARDDKHVTSVVIFMAAVLPKLCDEARAELGTVLGYQLHAVMDAFVKNGALMTRDVRDGLLSGFGKVLASCGLPESRVADMAEHALSSKRDELLRLFVHLPSAFVRVRPALVGALLDRAVTVPLCNRYPLLAMLAKLVADGVVTIGSSSSSSTITTPGPPPDPLRCDPTKIHDLVVSSLSGDDVLDSRTCLAIGTLVGAWDVTPLAAALARALTACSLALVESSAECSSAVRTRDHHAVHQAFQPRQNPDHLGQPGTQHPQHPEHARQLDETSKALKRPRV